MSLLPRFIRASAWSAGTAYVFFILNFLGQIFLARILMPSDFGVFAFSYAVCEIFTILLGFSTPQSFIYSEGGQRQFNACIKINFYSALVLLGMALAVSFILSAIYSYQYGVMIVLLSAGQGMIMLGNAYLAPAEKVLNYRSVALIQGFSSFSSLMLAVIFAYLSHSLWSLGARQVLNGLILLGAGAFFSPMSYRFGLKGVTVLGQLGFGIRTAVSRGLEVLYYRFPDFIVQLVMGKLALGNFYQARYLCYMPIKLTTPFTEQVLFSFLTSMKDDKAKLGKSLFWVNYAVIRALLLAAIVIMLFGQPIFTWIYGAKWAVAGEFFQNFALFVLFGSAFNAVQSACYSLKLQRFASQAYLIAIAAFLVGLFLSVKPSFSAQAFSFGFVLGYLYMLLRLKWAGVELAILRLLAWPFAILAAIFIMRLFSYKALTMLLVSLFLFTVMLLTEKSLLIKLLSVWKHLRHKESADE